MPMSRLFGGHVGDVGVVDEHAAGVRAVEAAEDPQRGRLAAPRRPEQRDQLALLDLEIEPGERGHSREVALNAFESNHQSSPNC